MTEDKKYGGEKNVQSRGVGQAKGTKAYKPTTPKSAVLGGKGSVKQPKGTYKYGRNVGVGTADAREARNKIGYKDYKPGAASNANEQDWLDALLNAGGGGGGGGGANTAAAQAAMAAQRAKMEALYKRYAEDIAAREAGITENYNTAATNLGGIYDTAVGNVNKAYDSARAAQNQQLLALGMTEQTPVQSFGNQTGATTSFENLRAAVLAQNEASRKNAITNQKLASEAATREGVDKLAAYDYQTAQALAEMQASSGGGGGGGGGGLSPYQYASLKLKQMGMDQDAQISAAKLAASSAPKAGRAPVDVIGIYNNLVAGGTDPAVAQKLAAVQAANMGG